MRILVSGASGFIGRALCRTLSDAGLSVRAAVRRPQRGIDADEVAIVGDLGAATDWRDSLTGVDVVIHLAARVHQTGERDARMLAQYRDTNVLGSVCLAQEAARCGVRRMVFVSSIKAMAEQTPFDESLSEQDAPIPVDPYGTSKWEAEQALQAVSHDAGLEMTIVRPPLVYGPGVRANFLGLMKAVSLGLPLPLAAIENRRSMVYLSNLTDALRCCATHPRAAGRVFLVSDGQDLSTPQLIRDLAAALGTSARLFPVPIAWLRGVGSALGRAAAIERLTESLSLNSSAIRETLGWRPPYSVQEGLTETARWFKQRRNEQTS